MKNIKELIKEAKIAISKKHDSNNESIDSNNELNAFDLMYHFV